MNVFKLGDLVTVIGGLTNGKNAKIIEVPKYPNKKYKVQFSAQWVGYYYENQLKLYTPKIIITGIEVEVTLPKFQPTFTMLIGIPGSGKDRWINKQNLENTFVVTPDKIRKELSGNISDQSRNDEVWTIAKAQTIYFLNQNQNVILNATNVNTDLRRKFLSSLPPCKKVVILFDSEPDICCERIKNDIKRNIDGTNVPESVVYRMYGEYLYTKKVIHEEDFNGFSLNIL